MQTYIQHPIYKRLLVGNMGSLISTSTWKELKTVITPKGYEELKFRVGSRTDKTRKTLNLKVHRLVAEMFIGKPEKPTVNHKDGNKLNNDMNNLEWATWSENNRHAIKNGLKIGKSPTPEHRKKMIDGWKEWYRKEGRNLATRKISYRGKTMSLDDWSKELGITKSAIRLRLLRGWTEEMAVAIPRKVNQFDVAGIKPFYAN